MSWSNLIRRVCRGQAGFTLTELLLAASGMVIVLGIALSVIPIALRAEPQLRDRAGEIQEGRALVERLTREMRSTYQVTTATPSALSFRSYLRRTSCDGEVSPSNVTAIPCQVSYSCSGGTCTRAEAAPGSTGSPVRVVDGLLGDDVFAYTPSEQAPTYVALRLAFPATGGEDAITLQDGVDLRNVSAP